MNTKNINIKVNNEIHKALKRRAADEETTITQLILSALMQAGALGKK